MPGLLLNQVLKGRKGFYRVIKSLAQNVYQANIEGTCTLSVLLSKLLRPRSLTQLSVVIKMAPEAQNLFINEINTYQHDCITQSPYIRSLREYINNSDSHCLVLEWMDNTLWETKEASIQAKAKVFKTVAKSCLEALAVFRNMDGTGPYLHAGERRKKIQLPYF
jgi:hypothetical protein